MPCEPEVRYATARSAPPVQIPDDLSPPDESDAIALAGRSSSPVGSITAGECLETPPSFFGDLALPRQRRFETGSAEARREAKRAGAPKRRRRSPKPRPAEPPEAG